MNRLVIGEINVNGINGKIDALRVLVTGNIDLLVIIESKLDESFTSAQFAIDGFSMPFRCDRNRLGGGILVYVREDLASKELKSHNVQNLEGIFIELNLRSRRWLLFAGYNNLKQNISNYLHILGKCLDTYLSKYENMLLIGDLNSEMSETSMREFCDIYNLQNLIKEPTCYKNPLNPSSIDLMLTNRIRSFQNSQTVEIGQSDHHKLTISVLRAYVSKQAPRLIKYRDYKHFDNNRFQQILHERLFRENANDISYNAFEKVFMDLLNSHAKVKLKYVRANNGPYINKAITKAIMNRSRLKNAFNKNPTQENKLIYKKQRNFCVNVLRREKRKYYKTLNLENVTNNKLFWKTIKPFFSEKTHRNEKITLVDKEKIISDDSNVADTFNTYFSNAVKDLNINGYQNDYIFDKDKSYIENCVSKFKNYPSIIKITEKNDSLESFSFSPCNISQMYEKIITLNKNKPTTENNIPAKILIHCVDTCAPILSNAYNRSLKEGDFPSSLKEADMTPLHKKDEKTLKENYRPVSILPTVSKIYERLMHTEIENYMKRFISPFLCGFRKGFNTQHCLLSMIEKMKKSLDKNHFAAAVLTDLSKAFDCINHDLLIAKLHAYGFSYQALIFLHSYVSQRKQRTKVNNSFSTWSTAETGVPQGSILGVLIFNIYINDIFYSVDENSLMNFADDNTPYETGKCLECILKTLDDNVDIISEWFMNNYLKMNTDKCHLLVPKHIDNVFLNVNNEKLIAESKVKLLGITIDNKLDFNEHVSNICKKASQKLHALTRISPYIDNQKLKIIMKAFIESQFSYCPLLWMFHNRTMNNRINRIQERALRIAYKDNESSFRELLEKDNNVTIHERNLQRLATEIYKVENELSPLFMRDIFPERATNYNLRNNHCLSTTNVKTGLYGRETISFRGPQIWSILPIDIKNSQNLNEFKNKITKWKPEGCTCRLCKTYISQLGFV